jgi:hypothetical protein
MINLESYLMRPSLVPARSGDNRGAHQSEPLELDVFYPYGYQGREMFAVRSPRSMSEKAEGLVGHILRADGELFRILSVLRQISGPIAQGEPVGVEVRRLTPEGDDVPSDNECSFLRA